METIESCRKSHTDIHYVSLMLTLEDWSEQIEKGTC